MEYFRTKHFTMNEMCTTSTGLQNIPNEKQKENIQQLIINVLEPLREKIGEPIIVTSGFRSEAVNKKVGGVWNSQHLANNGAAADITLKDKTHNFKLFSAARDMGIYDQLIWEKGTDKYPSWIHISYKQGANRKQMLRIK